LRYVNEIFYAKMKQNVINSISITCIICLMFFTKLTAFILFLCKQFKAAGIENSSNKSGIMEYLTSAVENN